MKNKVLLAIAATLLLLCGCAKDQELYDRVDDLDGRVSALEEAVRELNQITIPGMQSIVAAIQGNIYVTSVTPNADGYVIVFSNSTTAVIKNGENGIDGTDGEKGDKGDTPDIGIIEVDGEFYWAVDEEPLLDAEGNRIPVHSALPQLRISEGKWQVSYDEGATWTDVEVLGEPGGSTISIEDGDTTVTFYINGEAYEIQKEQPFYLVFESRKDLGVPAGEEYMFEYTVLGVNEGDELEVDVLNCTAGWEAKVVSLPQGETPGYIGVTNLENKDGKVFIYASNGRGKTDIKSLLFEEGILTADADVKEVPATGGNVTISVTTNMGYELYVDRTQTWISVVPQSKATHTDLYTLACEANATADFRSAEVDVITQTGDVPQVFIILQYPSEAVVTNIASLANVADNTTVRLYSETVLASSEKSAVISDGTNFLTVRGLEEGLPVGKEIDITGIKRTAADGYGQYLELASFEVTAETSSVTDPETTYYGLGQDSELPLYTSVTGPLAQEGDSYVVTAFNGQKVTIEAPVSGFYLSSKVGHTVTIHGYLISCEEGEPESYTIVINKAATVEFKENSAWTLSYEYDPASDADYPEVVYNTVSGSTVPYQLGILSVEEYEGFEKDPEAIAISLCDDLQYYYWYYNLLYGFTQSDLYDIFVHTDGQTGSDSFSELEYGTYYIVAAGTNQDGTPTGDYKIQEIEKKEPVSVARYEDFIGRWAMGNSTLIIEQKEEGSTYSVTGISNQAAYNVPAVEAEYADGKFILKEQATGGEWYNSNYGYCDMYLSGVFSSNSRTYGAYPLNTDEPAVILTGYMTGSTDAVDIVLAGSCNYGSFLSFGFSWVIREGENAGAGNTFAGTTIGSMRKLPEPTEEYKAWLGNYVLNTKSIKTGADTTYNVTLAEGFPNETILINGLGVDGIPIQYDPENNTCDLVYGQYSSNSSYIFYASGITNDGYVCTGEPGTGRIATFTKGQDNAINVENVVYSLSDERPEVYAEYWGTVGQRTSGGWVTFRDVDYVVNPATLTPSATATSRKSVANPTPEQSVKAEKAVVRPGETVSRKLSAPAQKTIDARLAKSGKASISRLSK